MRTVALGVVLVVVIAALVLKPVVEERQTKCAAVGGVSVRSDHGYVCIDRKAVLLASPTPFVPAEKEKPP